MSVEVRRQNGEIDEIVAHGCNIHIERMSGDSFFVGVGGADGSYWQFWIGARNNRSHVDVRHYETSPPENERRLRRAFEKRGTG